MFSHIRLVQPARALVPGICPRPLALSFPATAQALQALPVPRLHRGSSTLLKPSPSQSPIEISLLMRFSFLTCWDRPQPELNSTPDCASLRALPFCLPQSSWMTPATQEATLGLQGLEEVLSSQLPGSDGPHLTTHFLGEIIAHSFISV